MIEAHTIENKYLRVKTLTVGATLFEVYHKRKKINLILNLDKVSSYKNNKNYLDLYDAAKVILEGLKINSISGGDRCTFHESGDFFSFRRDGINSGRMAHLIWME